MVIVCAVGWLRPAAATLQICGKKAIMYSPTATGANFCVVGIFKNEAHALREWCSHYLVEGAARIYLIDNGSTDAWQQALEGYEDSVKVVSDPTRHAQIDLYNKHFLDTVRREHQWALVVDLDEFLYSREPHATVAHFLASLPPDVHAVQVPWTMFGSSGWKRQPNSIIHNFVWRQDRTAVQSGRFDAHKSATRTECLSQLGVHESVLRDALTPGRILKLDRRDENAPLQINHYAVQSQEYFENVKMRRGDVHTNISDNVRDWTYFEEYDVNYVQDRELSNKTNPHAAA